MRRFLAHLFAAASCLVLPLGLVSAWLDLVVTDTDRYVDTVGPIAKQEKVQRATQRWLEDVTVRTIDSISPLPVGESVRSLVTPAAAAVVASPDFERVWRAANRNIHPQVIGVLEGSTQGVGTKDGLISIELGDLVNAVLTELAGGDSFLGIDLTPVDVSIPIMRSEELRDAQDAYSVAEATGLWLLVGWAGLVLLALLIAPSRRSVLGTLGYGTVAAILALGGTLLWSREQVVQSALTPADARLVEAVYDVLLSNLWKVMGGLLAAGGAVILGRVVTRPS